MTITWVIKWIKIQIDLVKKISLLQHLHLFALLISILPSDECLTFDKTLSIISNFSISTLKIVSFFSHVNSLSTIVGYVFVEHYMMNYGLFLEQTAGDDSYQHPGPLLIVCQGQSSTPRLSYSL